MDKRSQGPEQLWLDDNLLEDEQQLCQLCFYLAVLQPVVGSCHQYSSLNHCCAIFMLALHHFTVRGTSSGFTQTEQQTSPEHSVCCIKLFCVFRFFFFQIILASEESMAKKISKAALFLVLIVAKHVKRKWTKCLIPVHHLLATMLAFNQKGIW